MAKITVKDIGPLKEVSLELKKVNVFMGPQSTGKSTIAKIISQALWAEKNYLTMGEEYDFYNGLLSFHNMDKNYFASPESEIIYESPWCIIHMKYERLKKQSRLKTLYRRKENAELYSNPKIEYIPAERNFVASIENIYKYNQTYNSTISFLNDWYEAKSVYQRKRTFPVKLPDLDFDYRYKESEEKDIVRMGGIEVPLQSGSSGQQSLLPLILVADSVMVATYNVERIFSPVELGHIKRKAAELSPVVELLSEIGKKGRTEEVKKSLEDLWRKIGYNADYGCTHLVIEEPEQNLYPSTQRGLLKHLVSLLVQDPRRQHTLTITTHSPYILYALNNCMFAGLIEPKVMSEELRSTAIAPGDVGLWLLKGGTLHTIQDDKDGLLIEDFFNAEFQQNHEEMFTLLKLLKR